MMKKLMIYVMIFGLCFTVGCRAPEVGQPEVNSRNSYYNQQVDGEGYNVLNQGDRTDAGPLALGYRRYERVQVHQENGQQTVTPVIDRDRLADGITRLVLTNETVDEAATLVTDEHILVTYTTNADNRDYVADQVKRTALSVAPRYYDVYISDDHEHFQDIERFQGLQSNSPNIENTIEQTIEKMKQSPQGWYEGDKDDNMDYMKKKHQRLLKQGNSRKND
ncbi:YhcN/YlaJ family sporulation lipoprotein [Halalkalibacterium halodurans]|nr:YhcN/YlaJ family sporulation lipoprotein [Halalkalibacterium halodurans]